MDIVLILDFGSQYSHIIVRRCRELGVYSEMVRCDVPLEEIIKFKPKAIILSGGPASVYTEDAPHVSPGFFDWCVGSKVPVLGICYGMQEMIHNMGGRTGKADHREFGHAKLEIVDTSNLLFRDIPETVTDVWMSHGDRVESLPAGFKVVATSTNSPYAAVANAEKELYGLQFHPEVNHTKYGVHMLKNFLINRVALGSWNMKRFAHAEIDRLRQLVGDRQVIGALSGGVDSTVAAVLLHKAIGTQFRGFMVDTGLLRLNEGATVIQRLKNLLPGIQIELLDEKERFFKALAGVTNPEQKRKIIGHLFIDSFTSAVDDMKAHNPPGLFDNAFLLQGTLYPDVIESVCFMGPSHTIKTHHNVGGLPEQMSLEVLEPLRELFKDEVRALGEELGLPHEIVWRHPFPGPGLAIRIIGEVTPERARILCLADAIFIEEIRKSGDYEKIGQAFAVLLPEVRTVGVMGDCRTYGCTVALRAIETSDFMTGDWYDMPHSVLKASSTRIINEIPSINRVVYDISSKPPATIEWE